MPHRTTLRSKGQLTLPAEVRDALHLHEGDDVEFTVTDDGDVLLRGLALIATDQAWFWSESWQAGEREASEQLAAGAGARYDDDGAFLASLSH